MKLVVLACALAVAFGQTADGNTPQYTHVKHSAAPVDSDAFLASSGGSTRGDSNTGTPVVDNVDGSDVPDDYVDNQEENQEESGRTFVNRKHSIHWDTHTNTTTGTTYDNNGRVMPTSTITYDAAAAKACCDGSTECSGSNACKFGCKSWLAYSSLNWEAAWRARLLTRCRKACLQPRKWRVLHEDKAKLEANHADGLSQSYWFGRTQPADGFFTVPYDKYSDAALPFHNAHKCASDSECTASGTTYTCSNDHDILKSNANTATANSVDGTSADVAECINTAEAECKAGCLAFATCQWNQDDAGESAPV